MPTLIVLFIVALITLTKPFRGVALGLLLLLGAICIGITAILWRFWIDCRNGITFALGHDDLRRHAEEIRRVNVTFNKFTQNLGEPIPVRPQLAMRGRESRSRRPD